MHSYVIIFLQCIRMVFWYTLLQKPFLYINKYIKFILYFIWLAIKHIMPYWFTWFSRCIVYVEHKWKNKARLIIFQDFLYVNYTELVPQYGMICFIANQIKYNMKLIYFFLYKNGFCKSVYPNTILIHCKNIIT